MILQINTLMNFVAIAPRTDALETPIHDPKKDTLWHMVIINGMNTKIRLTKARQIDRIILLTRKV